MISVIVIFSTKKTYAITTNVTKNCHSKTVRYRFDCCIFHTVISAIILLLIITIICYRYGKRRSKQKDIDALTI